MDKPATPRWHSWTHALVRPPRNRPILAFFPPYGMHTIEWTGNASGTWISTGALILNEFPTHWAEQPTFPER